MSNIAFPVIERFASVDIDALEEQAQFGRGICFISVSEAGPRSGKPRGIALEDLVMDLEEIVQFIGLLSAKEQYLAVRLLESGLICCNELARLANKPVKDRTLGQCILESGLCAWEQMLACCLETRSYSRADSSSIYMAHHLREWELTGEMLVSLGKINRTALGQALKIKREGSQALGQILTSMGACTDEDIVECLKLQSQIRSGSGSEVALIGQLLVSQGVLSAQTLDEALRNQKIGRQSLERILLSMGACSSADIAEFIQQNNWHHFQDEIDDWALGDWLVKHSLISHERLNEALRIQMRGRQVLGEMLISLKICSHADIESILKLQKDIRANYGSGVEKLGGLLVKRGKINLATLDKALTLQSIGRQPIGCILVAMDACTASDVSEVLELQRRWRDRPRIPNDRLGEVLVQKKAISDEDLDEAFATHLNDGQPLGRTLIEQGLCTPETIIDTLMQRDLQRHQEFLSYLMQQAPKQPQSGSVNGNSAIEPSIVRRLSRLFSKQCHEPTGDS
ncbi:MAG: hypothetical protein HY711_02380 [Candidatus Melainabacteria bacterium]|nr:hypothetical protein [Candidatus Melainabacteria bacterium]